MHEASGAYYVIAERAAASELSNSPSVKSQPRRQAQRVTLAAVTREVLILCVRRPQDEATLRSSLHQMPEKHHGL